MLISSLSVYMALGLAYLSFCCDQKCHTLTDDLSCVGSLP